MGALVLEGVQAEGVAEEEAGMMLTAWRHRRAVRSVYREVMRDWYLCRVLHGPPEISDGRWRGRLKRVIADEYRVVTSRRRNAQ